MDNNQKYLKLMAVYKKLRRNPDKTEQATKVLDAALKIGKMGVNLDTKEAARYL